MKCFTLLFLTLLFGLAMPTGVLSQENRGAVVLNRPADRSEKRTALVIGNSAYVEAPLPNPVNDASDIAATLRARGFEVNLLTDARRAEMIAAIRQFGHKLHRNGGVGLFFFAGHGLQVNGQNYLVPIDADIRKEHEVDDETVNVGRVLGEMETAKNRLNIVILDACRNNPYERSFRSLSRGLASIDAPRGTLIAYATAPGSVAADGSGRNSPYSGALIQQIPKPGEPIERVFKKVRAAVINKTNGAQIPWESSSLIGEFYFTPPDIAAANEDTETVGPTAVAEDDPNPPVQPTTDRPENAGTVTSERTSGRLRYRPQFVDQNQLATIAKSIDFTARPIRDGFDPNTVEFAILGGGWNGSYQFEASGNIVHERNSGLMWEQSGSKPEWNEQGYYERWGMNYQAARAYVAQLNEKKFHGYDNWRLPTVAEALTLLEPPGYSGKNDLRIDTDYFDVIQTSIWTADSFAGNRRWTVDFEFGQCSAVPEHYEISVRAVRSADGTSVPEFAAAPPSTQNREQTRSPNRAANVEITGYWYDINGTVFEISKNGAFYTFAALNILTGFASQGTVTLNGRQIQTEYRTNLPSFGRSEGTLSADGQSITVTVYDSIQGTYLLVLSRQAPY